MSQQSPLTFKGNLAQTLLDKGGASLGQKTLGTLLAGKEANLPLLTFTQDTLVALVPKLLISRSKLEGLESTIVEITESLFVYFGLPLVGGKAFSALMHKVAGKQAFPAEHLVQTVDTLAKNPTLLAKVLPAKAAVLFATIASIGLVGESISNYGKNLVTAYCFKKDKFSDVVNLSQGHNTHTPQDNTLIHKSWTRLAQVGTAFAGILAGSMALARFGPAALQRSPQATRALKKLVTAIDFNFGDVKPGKKPSFGLDKGMLASIMGLSFIPYLDSARDGYERKETLSRLPFIFAYLLVGQSVLEKLMQRLAGKKLSTIMNAQQKPLSLHGLAKKAHQKPLSLQELAEKALQETLPADQAAAALKTAELNGIAPELLQQAKQKLNATMKVKAMHTGIPLLVGVLGTGLIIGKLNQHWTKARYQRENNPKQPTGALTLPMQTRLLPAPHAMQPVSYGTMASAPPAFPIQARSNNLTTSAPPTFSSPLYPANKPFPSPSAFSSGQFPGFNPHLAFSPVRLSNS